MNELNASRETHVADHRPAQRSHRIGERRAESKRELLSRRASADHGPALENRDLVSGLGKIEGRCHAVVARADDDDRAQRLPSLMIFRAAFRPGAPMIPPPGWVADP